MLQVSLRELPSADTRDLWLAVGPPKDRQESNPLLDGIRVGLFDRSHISTQGNCVCFTKAAKTLGCPPLSLAVCVNAVEDI